MWHRITLAVKFYPRSKDLNDFSLWFYLLFAFISLHALFPSSTLPSGAESFAELFYHGCSVSLIKYQMNSTQSLVLLMAFLLLSLSKLLNSLSSNECLSIRWNALWIRDEEDEIAELCWSCSFVIKCLY